MCLPSVLTHLLSQDIQWADESGDEQPQSSPAKRQRKQVRADASTFNKSVLLLMLLQDDSDDPNGSELDGSESENGDINDGDNSIELVATPGASRLDLKPQHPRVRRAARKGIKEFFALLCTTNGWPEGQDETVATARRALARSAASLGDHQLANRIRQSTSYGEKLATIVSISFWDWRVRTDNMIV